jgi:aspartyl-tRNA(Asn)/glutamyl-tRNA(Gln) amidotransferase subunit C
LGCNIRANSFKKSPKSKDTKNSSLLIQSWVRSSVFIVFENMAPTSSHSHLLDIPYLARLARITLTLEESELFSKQLDRVLEHVALINKIDLTGIEPMAHAISVFDVVRDDQPQPSLPKKEALANAPHQASGLFIVPKVLE